MNSIHFAILLLLVALLCDEGISGVPSDIFNFRSYATNLSSARFPVGSDDCSNCLHTQSARFHVNYLLEDEDADDGLRRTNFDSSTLTAVTLDHGLSHRPGIGSP
mmetsp:Transcript_9307/g.12027  ORF Transcript_9307/g.12027 Transcript_9307/m.12027 type:complete len:105 (-) Transcript_9307:143-457(-)